MNLSSLKNKLRLILKWLKSFFTITYPKPFLILIICFSMILFTFFYFLSVFNPYIMAVFYVLMCHAMAKAIIK